MRLGGVLAGGRWKLPRGPEVMKRPPPLFLVLGSLALALTLNLLPWHGLGRLVRPDLLLVVLLYWSLQMPRTVGQGAAFVLGLLMDIGDSSLMGLNALTYVAAVYVGQALRLRILGFSWLEQALHIAGIVALALAISIGLNLSVGGSFPGWALAVQPLFAALAWPLVSWLLEQPLLESRELGPAGTP